MRELRFKVSGQTLRKAGDFSRIVTGSRGFLRCRFDFDETWNGFAKAAAFTGEDGAEHAERIVNGQCAVPDDVTAGDSFTVRVVGKRDGAKAETTAATVRQVRS